MINDKEINEDKTKGDSDPDEGSLKRIAQRNKLRLPRTGKVPRRWPLLFSPPGLEPIELAKDQRHFLRRVLRHNRGILLIQILVLGTGSITAALFPWGIGKMIDSLTLGGVTHDTIKWVLIFAFIVVIHASTDSLKQLFEAVLKKKGGMDTVVAVTHQITKAKRNAKTDTSAGDIVNSVLNDSDHIVNGLKEIAETVSSLLATVVIVILMLESSVQLAMIIIVGLPLSTVLVLTLARPLQRKQAKQREEQGILTTIGADAVLGLRILRGIGGEKAYNQRYQEQSQRVYEVGVEVARNFSLLVALRSSIPLLFNTFVVSWGAYLTAQGKITAGELVAFYGYISHIRRPIMSVVNLVSVGTRSLVGIRKMSYLYNLKPSTRDNTVGLPKDTKLEEERTKPADTKALDKALDSEASCCTDQLGQNARYSNYFEKGQFDWESSKKLFLHELYDEQTKISFTPGKLSVIVCQKPGFSSGLAKRITRISDDDEVKLITAKQKVDLRQIPLSVLRKNLLLSEEQPQLFQGTLLDNLKITEVADKSVPSANFLIFQEFLEQKVDLEKEIKKENNAKNLSNKFDKFEQNRAELVNSSAKSHNNNRNDELVTDTLIEEDNDSVESQFDLNSTVGKSIDAHTTTDERGGHEGTGTKVTEMEVYQAIEIADAKDVLESLGNNLQASLEEKGRNLSGGQRQRVALARSIIADPAILVLVEPTSAVDSHTESRIAQKLKSKRRGKTTIVVSTSPLWLEYADDIVVLDEQGRYLTRGTHQELLRRYLASEAEAQAYYKIISREVESSTMLNENRLQN